MAMRHADAEALKFEAVSRWAASTATDLATIELERSPPAHVRGVPVQVPREKLGDAVARGPMAAVDKRRAQLYQPKLGADGALRPEAVAAPPGADASQRSASPQSFGDPSMRMQQTMAELMAENKRLSAEMEARGAADAVAAHQMPPTQRSPGTVDWRLGMHETPRDSLERREAERLLQSAQLQRAELDAYENKELDRLRKRNLELESSARHSSGRQDDLSVELHAARRAAGAAEERAARIEAKLEQERRALQQLTHEREREALLMREREREALLEHEREAARRLADRAGMSSAEMAADASAPFRVAREELGSLAGASADLQQKLSASTAELTRSRARVAELEALLEVKTGELRTREEQLQGRERQLEESEAAVRERDARLKTLGDALTALAKQAQAPLSSD